MAKTPEGEVQAYGTKKLEKQGCLVRKLSYEGRRGCPDQLVLVPKRLAPRPKDGLLEFRTDILFIEYKRDELTQPEPHQLREHERMRTAGADVRIIGSKAQVDALIQELFGCQ